jgi:hypothetical protein
MSDDRKIIEIDCDGVLTDLVNSSIRAYNLKSMPKPYHPADYGMHDAGSDRPLLFAAFSDPEVIEQCSFYPNAVKFLSKLSESLNNNIYRVDVRTLLANEECKQAREKVFADVFKQISKNDLFSCTVVVGNHADAKDAKEDIFIYVEDYVDNLVKSNAKYKILIDHTYNQEADNPKLKTIDYIRVHSLDECYAKIMEVVI